MAFQRLLSGDPSRSSALYLGIGVLSLVKAIAVRNDRNRFRRELFDAGLFIGVGLLLRRYSTLKTQKREEIRSQLPDWLVGEPDSRAAVLRERAKRRFAGEPEPEPTLADRARQMVATLS